MADEPFLLTPGPLTTSMRVKRAMLRDWGSRDGDFIALNAEIRERLTALVDGGHAFTGDDAFTAVPLQGSGTFVVEAMLGTLVPRDGRLLVLVNGAYGERMVKIAGYHGRAVDTLKTAEDVPNDPAALDAKLAIEPFSIYISRATQMLYVRRNTHKPAPDGGGEVFDATIEVPVTIRDPGKPLGTHVFTAVARNDGSLRWTAVTIENGDDAKNALDRITIPKEVLDRIAPAALPRSSIVVSDEPLSKETNYRTEFVAVLSDQPQGGFITRKPSQVLVADDGGWSNGSPQADDGFGFFFQRSPIPRPSNTRRGGGQFFPMQGGWW